MFALIELLDAIFHVATAARWLFSPSFRAELRQDRSRYGEVGVGFVFLGIILIGIVHFITG